MQQLQKQNQSYDRQTVVQHKNQLHVSLRNITILQKETDSRTVT
jgi:hypothetical protein